jgi:hypothetical protein
MQISVQTPSDWFWVCDGTGNLQEPRIRCIVVTLVTQGMMQQRKERYIFVSKFYIDSKKVSKKFLHHSPSAYIFGIYIKFGYKNLLDSVNVTSYPD